MNEALLPTACGVRLLYNSGLRSSCMVGRTTTRCPLYGGLVSCRGASADGVGLWRLGVRAHVPLMSCGLVGRAHARVLCRVCVVCARRDSAPRGVGVPPRAAARDIARARGVWCVDESVCGFDMGDCFILILR